MSYMHIDNLYKNQDILMFKECYAMEKIHGTSAHISYKQGEDIKLFSGGAKYEEFIKLFDHDFLRDKFYEIGWKEATIFGEAYGGKMQGMSKTYGPNLRFIAFEVMGIPHERSLWLNVPDAESFVAKFGLDFVHYKRIPCNLEAIDAERDDPSVQGLRLGMGEHIREGVVLRPIVELITNNGERIIAKHKRDEFRETATPRKVIDQSSERLEAQKAADEWVTEMRLQHVLQNFSTVTIEDTGKVINAMVEDIIREAGEEIVNSSKTKSAIGRNTALAFKQYLARALCGAK